LIGVRVNFLAQAFLPQELKMFGKYQFKFCFFKEENFKGLHKEMHLPAEKY
jgi:hypothetical protein